LDILAIGLATLFASAGCGDGNGKVNGTVTFDDQPVASGTITFVKQDGELAREGAVIQGGSFQAVVPPGKYKLELNAQKVKGTRTQKGFDGKDEEVEITEELFPARFNTQTELSREIKAGVNKVQLDLMSKK
jgi:hypothetical protein